MVPGYEAAPYFQEQILTNVPAFQMLATTQKRVLRMSVDGNARNGSGREADTGSSSLHQVAWARSPGAFYRTLLSMDESC